MTFTFPGVVAVFDVGSDELITTIPTGRLPLGVTSSPDRSRVYVTNDDGEVYVINTHTYEVDAVVHVGGSPSSTVFLPDGSRAYVRSHGTNQIAVIATATTSVIATIQFPAGPYGMDITPDGSRIYVATGSPDSKLYAVDASSHEVTAVVELGGPPQRVRVAPDGQRVYVSEGFSYSRVRVFSTSTHDPITTIDLAAARWPTGLALTPDGAQIWVANYLDNVVHAISSSTYEVLGAKQYTAGSDPFSVATSSDGTRAYVTLSGSSQDRVSILDTQTRQEIGSLSAAGLTDPRNIALLTPGPVPPPSVDLQGPARAGVVNRANAGQVVPVSFSLGGDLGLNVFKATYPKVVEVPCTGTTFASIDAAVAAVRESRLTYSNGRYTYHWVTDKAWAGSCRQLKLAFTGLAGELVLEFQFR